MVQNETLRPWRGTATIGDTGDGRPAADTKHGRSHPLQPGGFAMLRWKRRRKTATSRLHSDDRLPDGDTVLRPDAVRWTTLYRNEQAGTSDGPLMTPGMENRTSSRGIPGRSV